MSSPSFHALPIKKVSPEAAGSVAITFDIPSDSRDKFHFEPGHSRWRAG
jgi:ring-1,2-phenylacetyl-CoA epoxidase subunit PaaE